MSNLLHTLEDTAARGAAGLLPEARETLSRALLALRQADGGFAGLDGRSDPYYSLFAWLSLRALRAGYERAPLCAYMRARRRDRKRVDAQCAALVLACEGQGSHASWLALLPALASGDTREVYAAFLKALATNGVPRWLARCVWLRQRSLFVDGGAERLPTPRLAAGLVLAGLAGLSGSEIAPALQARRCACGGFASASGAQADLLATAVARFALRVSASRAETPRRKEERDADLAFVESCWLDDGLFGASPAAHQGDAEHTFHGLLALGTCR